MTNALRTHDCNLKENFHAFGIALSCALRIMPGMKRALYFLPALLLFAEDALAWGLYTHVWFAQALLWLVPLADSRFREAARRFPRLVMAGACLPDLVLVQRVVPEQKFSGSHGWVVAAQQLELAQSDEERALALGFASHLFTDIFAHNHFVPAHESVWLDIPMLTHASCEWALDHHVRAELFATPQQLLREEQKALISYLGRHFSCDSAEAQRLLMTLARADGLLRFSGLPALAHGVGSILDQRMRRRFRHYLGQTVQRLPQINALIAGECPQWQANPPRHLAHAALAGQSMRVRRSRMGLPDSVFAQPGSMP